MCQSQTATLTPSELLIIFVCVVDIIVINKLFILSKVMKLVNRHNLVGSDLT